MKRVPEQLRCSGIVMEFCLKDACLHCGVGIWEQAGYRHLTVAHDFYPYFCEKLASRNFTNREIGISRREYGIKQRSKQSHKLA